MTGACTDEHAPGYATGIRQRAASTHGRTQRVAHSPQPTIGRLILVTAEASTAYPARVAVDVYTQIEIVKAREQVAAFAADPDNATRWYTNIKSVEWKSSRPLAVGSEVAFVAQFLGRRLAYTYQVREWEPGSRFVMSTQQGPFPMETTYEWEDTANGGTRMTLRNRGNPSGFSRWAAPLMTTSMRRANRKDLLRLKDVLES